MAKVRGVRYGYKENVGAGASATTIFPMLRDILPDKPFKIVGVDIVHIANTPAATTTSEVQILKNVGHPSGPPVDGGLQTVHGLMFQTVDNSNLRYMQHSHEFIEPLDFDKDDSANLYLEFKNGAGAASANGIEVTVRFIEGK